MASLSNSLLLILIHILKYKNKGISYSIFLCDLFTIWRQSKDSIKYIFYCCLLNVIKYKQDSNVLIGVKSELCTMASHPTPLFKDSCSLFAPWQLLIRHRTLGHMDAVGSAGALNETEQRDLILFFTKVQILLKERQSP